MRFRSQLVLFTKLLLMQAVYYCQMEEMDERVAHILPCLWGKYDVCKQGTQEEVHYAHSGGEIPVPERELCKQSPT